jgi:hypothetical protein
MLLDQCDIRVNIQDYRILAYRQLERQAGYAIGKEIL